MHLYCRALPLLAGAQIRLPNRRTLAILVLAVIALTTIVSVTYYVDFARNNAPVLPPGCAKPPGGYLITASKLGYNDSISHGAPGNSWPMITVHLGQNVTIIVCNIDLVAHGFQITHYFMRSQENLVPGQVLRISFVADQAGAFTIYCDVLCPIHIYMQNGLLTVA